MSETIRPRARAVLPAPEALDELEQGDLTAGVGDVFERIWHLFISMRTGLALMLGLALMTLIGTVLVQAPVGLKSDPSAYAAWLETVKPKYGGWTGIFDTVGALNIFSSIWFRGTIVLLATSILACSVNRAPRLWKQAVHPRPVVSPAFFSHARMSETIVASGTAAVAAEAIQEQLAKQRYRTIVTKVDGGLAVYADRFRWAPFGTVIAHVSLIFILGGAMFGATGFRDTDVAVAVGSTVPVGNGTTLSVEALSFTDAYYDNGSPADYASSLVVYDKGVKVAE
jgi:cytochrome c biogenesis protein